MSNTNNNNVREECTDCGAPIDVLILHCAMCRAERQGAAALRAGKKLSDNPYQTAPHLPDPPETYDQWVAWKVGYDTQYDLEERCPWLRGVRR